MVANPGTSYCDAGCTADHGPIKQLTNWPVVLVALGFAAAFYYISITVFKFVTHVLQIVKRLWTQANTWFYDQPLWLRIGFLAGPNHRRLS